MTKKLFLPLLLVIATITAISCKKVKDKLAETLLMKLITDNEWVVSTFTVNGEDITADYSEYVFDFYDNGKVFAIKNGQNEYSGSWNPDEVNQTITSNFPTATTAPIKYFNGVWYITNTKLNPHSVEAKMTNADGLQLKLKLIAK